MAESVYIESSVISYLTARPSRDVIITARQAITEIWWRDHQSKFEAFISGLVVQEISKGDEEAAQRRLDAVADIPLLGISEEALVLAQSLLMQSAVP